MINFNPEPSRDLSSLKLPEKKPLKGLPAFSVHDEKSIRGFFGQYRFLSNFHPASVTYEGVTFPSVENAYQSQKYPESARAPFLTLPPGEAKTLGKAARIDIDSWNGRKLQIMADLVFIKFAENPELRARLIATSPKYLEETNSWGDTFYGVFQGVGENNLGKILMRLRSYFLGQRTEARQRFEEHFGKGRVFLPVIHLYRGLAGAREAVNVALKAGANGVFLINQGMDLKGTLYTAAKLFAEHPDLWAGINPLGRSIKDAVKIASDHGFKGLWVDYAGVDSLDASEIKRFRQDLSAARIASGWKGLFFGGTAFKTSAPVPEELIYKTGAEAASFMDVVTTSGPATNQAAAISKVVSLAGSLWPVPFALASGVRPENVKQYLPYVDAYLVASGIEAAPGILDQKRTQMLADLIHADKTYQP